MSGTNPVEVVLAFIGQINAHNVDGLCDLMTPDHRFVDAGGAEVHGMEEMRKAWITYLQWFPDYRISPQEILRNGDVVGVFGTARGTYCVDGVCRRENSWEIPAAWKAVVKKGAILEWRVYAENEPVCRIMAAPKR